MTVTEKFFVLCLKSALKGETVKEVPKDIDYKTLYKLCTTHAVTVAVFYAVQNLKGIIYDKFYLALQKSVQRHTLIDTQSKFDIEKVIDVLEKNGIKFMPLKGYFIKPLYPSPEMRYASDCDILIDNKDLKKCRTCVRDLGLVKERFDTHHDIYYFDETKTVFEFHKMIFVGSLGKYFGTGFERAKKVEGKSMYRLSDSDFYISVLGHIAYHFYESAGVGIRSLMDIYVLRHKLDLDNGYIEEELKKCSLYDLNREFVLLSEYFFEDKSGNDFTPILANYVLESSMLANEGKKSASEISSNQNEGENGKRYTLFRTIFPKKEKMQFTYPVLKKAGILLPLFYVVRWFRVIFKTPARIKKLKEIKATDTQAVADVKKIRDRLGINKL